MSNMKSLAKDTAIYGLSSIIGRFLNWCLVPLYTICFDQAEYGVVTYMYAAVALALILLTYGMETGFFRFANHERWSDPMEVYSTALISLACTGTLFIAAVWALLGTATDLMECPGHEDYVMMMAVCVAIDAFSALPFSYLRYKCRAVRFAVIRLINIGINIGLNLFFILLCPWLDSKSPGCLGWLYNPNFGIGYIFLSNLAATIITLLMLVPELTGFKWKFNGKLWREMLIYSAPLLVLGVAGIMNQTLGQLLFPALDRSNDPMAQLGIYGANYKIAIVMVMFIQAFRFAYEPFIFSQNKKEGAEATKSYSDAMKYFVIAALFIFLGVMFYLDILKYFISARYFSGLAVVPIIMVAELCFGIFFNLSVWYKLTDQTKWGAWFSLGGLAITVVLNILLVPRYSYMGCAWAALGCYSMMMMASYFVGQAKYPIKYPVKRIGAYALFAAVLYFAAFYLLDTNSMAANWIIRAFLLAAYVVVVSKYEKFSGASLIKPILSKLRR